MLSIPISRMVYLIHLMMFYKLINHPQPLLSKEGRRLKPSPLLKGELEGGLWNLLLIYLQFIMIRLSKKWSYALKAVIYMAQRKDERVKISDISQSSGISEWMVRRIVADLEKVHIVETVKGRNGGVRLGKNPSQISVYDILDSVWEELGITECTRGEFCERIGDCSTTYLLWNLQKWFHSLLKINTLDKII